MKDSLKYVGLPLEQYEKYIQFTPDGIKDINGLRAFGKFPRQRFDQLLEDSGKDYFEIDTANKQEEDYITDNDWKYHINKYNFRDPFEFDDRPAIGFFGCSFTFAEGVESQSAFPSLVSKHFNYRSFNFGSGGASVHKIARTFSAVPRFIDLDYAVITLPHWHRQLYTDEETGDIVNLIPGYPYYKFEKQTKKLTTLDDTYYLTLTSSFISWMNDVAERHNIKVYFSSWDNTINDLCKVMIPEKTIKTFPNVDRTTARDKMHPGIQPHRKFANYIIKAMNQ